MLKLWITIKEVILMKNYISTPTISEMLKEEFMEPLGLTAYRLAKDIKVPVSSMISGELLLIRIYGFANILVCLMVFS